MPSRSTKVLLAVGASRPPTQVKSNAVVTGAASDRSKAAEAAAQNDDATWYFSQLCGVHVSFPVDVVVVAASVARPRKTRVVVGAEKRMVAAWWW